MLLHLALAVALAGMSAPVGVGGFDDAPHTMPRGWQPEQADDMMAVLQQAATLASDGQHEQAANHYLWLWGNMLEKDPSMVGVRTSFMASEMQTLANRYPPARSAFALLRSELTADVGDDWQTTYDWVVLNEIVGEEERTVEWVREHADDPQARSVMGVANDRIVAALIAHGEFPLLGRLYDDPIQEAREDARSLRHMCELLRDDGEMLQFFRESYLDEIGTMYAALLAAERGNEAAALLAAASVPRDDLPDERPAMVARAVEFGVAQAEHRALLDAAEGQGANVATIRFDLEAALAARESGAPAAAR